MRLYLRTKYRICAWHHRCKRKENGTYGKQTANTAAADHRWQWQRRTDWQNRDEQKNRDFNLTSGEKGNIANDSDVPKSQIADLKDLGAANGRDDYSGGSNDGMNDVSTNKPTDHL